MLTFERWAKFKHLKSFNCFSTIYCIGVEGFSHVQCMLNESVHKETNAELSRTLGQRGTQT